MESVRLDWYDPFRPENFWRMSIAQETMGLYMYLDGTFDKRARWWHYYDGSLLYIGKVYQQTFLARLIQHIGEEGENDPWPWIEENHEFEVTTKIARIALQRGNRLSKEMVHDIESLLIAVMQPRGNWSGTRTYSGRDLTIFNSRRFQPLRKVVSTGLLR
jgi:hypothetical protein